jgi:hypothetical protein
MDATKLVDTIKKALGEVKEKQQEVVSVDAMINYLDALEEEIGSNEVSNKNKFEADLTAFRAEHERNLAHYEAQQLHSVEMLRSVIAYGLAALKSSMLINGGAAVAMLAFIGKIWEKSISVEAVNLLTNSIAFFSFGVLLAAIGSAGSYFTQYCYSESHHKIGMTFHALTVVMVIGAYVLFGLGSYEAYQAFVNNLHQ